MSDSLVETLPKIIKQGKREAQRILDGLSKSNRITLQTNELVLPSKDSSGLFRGQIKDIDVNEWYNRLIYGDNLLAMQALLSGDDNSPSLRGKLDLIYIDPPYDSKADYRTKVELPNVNIVQKPTVIEQFAYSDTWKEGTASYLLMMVPRLILMRELLSENGSIYVHIDWHVGHYLKIIMDEIFGRDNFINEITWAYRTGGIPEKLGYAKKHDTILFYAKNKKYAIWNPQKEKQYLNAYGIGKQQGAWAKKMGIMLDKDSKPYRYSVLRDVWTMPPLFNASKERVGFPTQKPIELLSRIIDVSSNPDSIVADFFGGCGSFADAANGMRIERPEGEVPKLVFKPELKRKWISGDISKVACMVTRKRLVDNDSKPFVFQSIGDYQKEQYEKSDFRTIRDLAHVVINLYGATPFPANEGAPANAGYIKQSRTLVVADSPSKMTGYNTLKRAQEFRNSYAGGWKKVVVLGWNFVSNIGEIISSLNDKNLEVLVIPADLLDILKTKAKYRKLIQSGKVKFSSLQYLTLKPVLKTEYDKNNDKINVELDNYTLLSPDALPLDDKNKALLENVITNDPLSLIEYWSIDPDYDGEVFHSKWQDYRQNIANDNDPFKVVRKAELIIPKENRKRKVCVKAVDVFGFESASVVEVE
ncbi:DNA methylase [anaerobic digester metagenome]